MMISARSIPHTRSQATTDDGRPPLIRFQCPECRQALKAAAKPGSQVSCPVCHNVVVVPHVATEPGTHRKTLVWACPLCESPLRLIKELHNRRIRCRECESVLVVSTKPWALTIQTAGQRSRPAILDPDIDALAARKKRGKRVRAPKVTDTPTAADAAAQAMTVTQTPPPPETADPQTVPLIPIPSPPPAKKKGKSQGAPRRSLPLGPSLAVSFTIVTVLAGLFLVWWTLFGSSTVDPRLRHLPHQYDAYTTLNVPELLKSPIYRKGRDSLPRPPRLEVFENFLGRLGIPLGGVKRISFASELKSDGGGVVVYEMEGVLDPAQIVSRPAIQSQVRSEERVAGKRFFSLGTIAVCFAEPKIVLVGRTELLRTSLETATKRKKGGVLQKLVPTLDFDKTSLNVYAGLPPSELMRNLMRGTDLGSQVVSTVDEGTYQDRFCLTRTLAMTDERSAKDLARSFESRVKQILDDSDTGENVIRVLESIRISADKSSVVLQLSFSPDDLNSSLVAFLNRAY